MARAVLLSLLLALPLAAATTSEAASTLLAKADAAKADGRFDLAFELYFKSYQSHPAEHVREKMHDCLRQSAQHRRQRDKTFRQYVRELPPAEALNLFAEIIQKLGTHHAEKDKAKPERLFVLALLEIERALADPAFRRQHLPKATETALTKFLTSLKQDWSQRLPTTVREARAALQELVRQAQDEINLLEPTPLVMEAICGVCAGLDESTAYLAPPQLKDKSGEPTVTRVEMLDAAAGVGFIAISRFREETIQEFDQAVQRLRMEGMHSLVLDIRGNSGGSFTAALRLAERFIPAGVLATTTGQSPEFHDRVFTSESGMNALTLPLVVLVDGKTMSAAEVFAAAVKEQGRGTLIGQSTFGKGTVQSPLSLSAADSPVKSRSGLLIVTIAKVLSPAGTPLQGAGIVPNVLEREPDRQLRLAVRRAAELTTGM